MKGITVFMEKQYDKKRFLLRDYSNFGVTFSKEQVRHCDMMQPPVIFHASKILKMKPYVSD